jgi:hypothetical protein
MLCVWDARARRARKREHTHTNTTECNVMCVGRAHAAHTSANNARAKENVTCYVCGTRAHAAHASADTHTHTHTRTHEKNTLRAHESC